MGLIWGYLNIARVSHPPTCYLLLNLTDTRDMPCDKTSDMAPTTIWGISLVDVIIRTEPLGPDGQVRVLRTSTASVAQYRDGARCSADTPQAE